MKKKLIIIYLLTILIIPVFSGCGKKEVKEVKKEEVLKKVDTLIVEKNENINFLESTATVKAETQVEVTATAGGTIRNLFFQVGDLVYKNQTLSSIYNSSLYTNLNNAQINYNNMQTNLSSVERLSDETIKQAKIGIRNSQEAINSAQIALDSSKTNLENAKSLKEKNLENAKENALVSFHSFINSVYNTLDQVNYIIGADETRPQIEGISKTISAKNKNALSSAKSQYNSTESNYKVLSTEKVTIDNVETMIDKMISLLNETKVLVDDTIAVIDNTVSSDTFSDASLNTQRANFVNIKNTLVGNLSSAEAIKQNFKNHDLNYKKEIDALENAVELSRNQLKQAELNYENAQANLKSAQESKNQQLTSSQNAIDNAKGNVDLIQVQTGDLNVQAPIAGEITKKYVEEGTEINQGQAIAQISQTNNVKIEAFIPSEDIYKLKVGDKVMIQDMLEANINKIDSIADPATKKVRIEILFNNEEKLLIPGTTVNIKIEISNAEQLKKDAIYIPLDAVKIEQTENIVFIYKDGLAKKLSVKLGKMEESLVEVTEGLNIGDELITQGSKLVTDGEKVEKN